MHFFILLSVFTKIGSCLEQITYIICEKEIEGNKRHIRGYAGNSRSTHKIMHSL